MNKQTFCLVSGAVIGLTLCSVSFLQGTSALGAGKHQAGQMAANLAPAPHTTAGKPTSNQLSLGMTGDNYLPLTPHQQAVVDQMQKLNEAAATALDAKQYATAEADARESVAIEYGSGAGQELLAATLYLEGKDQEALQAYQVLGNGGFNDMADALPYTLLLLKAGRWPEAVSSYNKSLTLGGDVGMLRANSHFSPNVPQPAALEAALHIAIGLDSGWPGYHGTLQQRRQQEVAQFQQALTMDPQNPVATYYYGYGLYDAGKRGQAHTEFQKAADMGNDSVKAAAEQRLHQ